MKAAALILLLVPIACFAQDKSKKETSKSSATDCPDWNKKAPVVSKASYFESLRHVKAPKEQVLVAGVPEKEIPAGKTAVKSVKKESYVPSFTSGSDKIMAAEKKPEPAANDPLKEEISPEKPEANVPAAKAVGKAEKKAVSVSEKKVKKKSRSCNSGKVKASRRNAQACPEF